MKLRLNFEGQKIFVGIDVHLKSWTVTILVEDIEHKRFTMNPSPESLFAYLKKNFPGGRYFSVYEAGFCGFWIHDQLTELGITSIMVNPADIPTTDKEKKHKEDKRDSRKLAKCLRANYLEPIRIPSKKNRADRKLIRTRKTISKDKSRQKSRIKASLHFYGIDYPAQFAEVGTHWSRSFVSWLEGINFGQASALRSFRAQIDQYLYLRKEELAITREIRNLSRTDLYEENVSLLLSIPGVGIITAMTFLTEIEDISLYPKLDHLLSYLGLVPSTRSSGENDRAIGITPRGRKILKGMIVESAWSAVRSDPSLLMTFTHLKKKMNGKKAIIRIAKKLVNRMRFVLKNKKKYEIRHAA